MFKQILKFIEEEHLARQNLAREQALELVEKLLNKEQTFISPSRASQN